MKKKVSSRSSSKAYENKRFLNSSAARPIRILSEYVEPDARFQKHQVRDTIVFFGSARARPLDEVERLHKQALEERKKYGRKGAPKELRERLQRIEWDRTLAHYYDDSYELARLLTQWAQKLGSGNRFVITSGGGPGIMEAANRGASEGAKGPSIGLGISLPGGQEPSNRYVSPDFSFEFHYFFMRKLWFVYKAAAIVIFPGGFGTMDELFEVLTLRQTKKAGRPIPIVLYGSKFWREVVNFETMVRWGTISRSDLELFRICNKPKEAFEYLQVQLKKYYEKTPAHGV